MISTARAAAVVAGLAAAAAIAAGCGNDESNEYVDEVNQLQVELVNEVTDTVAEAPAAGPNGYRKVAAELRGAFETKADEFAAVEAPDEVANLHAQLVDGIRAVGEQIGEAERGFASGNPQKAQEAATSLQQAGAELQTRLNTVIDEINAQLGD